MKTTLHRIVRRLSGFAWRNMLLDVGRVEWKYGRRDDGSLKQWKEWDDVRDHLIEAGHYTGPKPKT